jgi:3-methyladenine DNA glycosylase AlkD
MNSHHQEILNTIIARSGKTTQHTFLDGYLGNTDPKYPIDNPTLRSIAKGWVRDHLDFTATEFKKLITSLLQGKSATEKVMAGMLLDASQPLHRNFNPAIFEKWLNHVTGWAQVDVLCSGAYAQDEILKQWTEWKKLLIKLSRSSNINKRRASLVLLCAPNRKHKEKKLVAVALANIERLKHEKEILITKAISWLLRCLVKHHKKTIEDYIARNKSTLPAVAVRETLIKIKTGKKSGKL